jgi:hypothetical protein
MPEACWRDIDQVCRPLSEGDAVDSQMLQGRLEALEKQASQSTAETRRLDRLRIWLGFAKFLLGTVALGVMSAVLNKQIQDRTLAMKEQEQQQEYVKQFVSQALDDNLEKRVRFAHYFSSLLSGSWNAYYDGVTAEFLQQKEELAKAREAEEIAKKADPTSPVVNSLQRQIQVLENNLTPQNIVPPAASATRYEPPISFSQSIVDRVRADPSVPYPRDFTPVVATPGLVKAIVLHTAVAPDAALELLRKGRPGTKGPLAHWAVTSDGTVHGVAPEGTRALHLGSAAGGLSNGNTIGVEATGIPALANERQLEGLVRLVLDIAERWQLPTDKIVSHAEVAAPLGRKRDMAQQAPVIRQMISAIRGEGDAIPAEP